MKIGYEREDAPILLQKFLVSAENHGGRKRNAGPWIVQNNHAFDPGFGITGSVNLVHERLRTGIVGITFAACETTAIDLIPRSPKPAM